MAIEVLTRLYTQAASNLPLVFAPNANDSMTISAAGNVGIGNGASVIPLAGADIIHLIVGSSSPSIVPPTSARGMITAGGNTTSTSQGVGYLCFANYAITVADKRIAQITGSTDGALDSGKIQFATCNAGVYGTHMAITALGTVGIANDASILPFAPTGYTNLIVGPTTSSSYYGIITVCRNTPSTASGVGIFCFANYAISGTEKRIAEIQCATDGAINSGKLYFETWNAGVVGTPMVITALGNVGIGNDASVRPFAATGHTHLIVGPRTSSTYYGNITACGNTADTAAAVGSFAFANFAIAAAEKRIARIYANTDGAINSGKIVFTTWNAGVIGERMAITALGNVGIGNDASILPFTGTAYTHLIVGPSTPSTYQGTITACGNTASTSEGVGRFCFVNYAITATAKRIAEITGATDGAIDSGKIQFATLNATFGIAIRMTISSSGYVGIGNDGTIPPWVSTGYTHLMVGQNTGSGNYGVITACKVATSTGGQNVGFFCFANYANTGAEKRVAQIVGSLDGALDSGKIQFDTWDAGVLSTIPRMLITATGNIGIGNNAPAYKLHVTGDINITGSYRVNGVSIATAQTPWTSNINAAGFKLISTGDVGIGNDASVLPLAVTGYKNLIVGPSTSSAACGIITACGNTTSTSGDVGLIFFANYAITVADKRIAEIIGRTDGAINSGKINFGTWNAGVYGLRMVISAAGIVGIGNDASVSPHAVAGHIHLIVGPTTASTYSGFITACGNTTSGSAGAVSFANYAIAVAEKRIAQIAGLTDGANNSGRIYFNTWNAGVEGTRMVITAAGNVGIGTTSPAYKLEVSGGDINITGSYRVNGVSITAGGGYQTPWLSEINAAGFKLISVGNVGIGNDASVLAHPTTGHTQVIVGPTTASNYYGMFAACGNTTSTSAWVGAFSFANYVISAADKRIAEIAGGTDGASNSGKIAFYTWNAGTAGARMAINRLGNVGIGNDASAAPYATTSYTHLIVGPTTLSVQNGFITACGNTTTASGAAMGYLCFANYAIAAADKRIAQIAVFTDGAINSGKLEFTTWNAGVWGTRMAITPAGNVGIGTITPAYKLEVAGDVNITGSFRVNGVSITAGGGYQTPWLSDINAAGFKLINAGDVGIGNDASVLPHSFVGYTNLIVGPTSPGLFGMITACGNKTNTNAIIGELFFANYAITAEDKRIAVISSSTDDAIDSGKFYFYTMNAGVQGVRMTINALGNVGIGNAASVIPMAGAGSPNLVVGPTTPSGYRGYITACGNMTSTSTSVGSFGFANYAITAAEKRIADIYAATDGAINSGKINFRTFNAGVAGDRMTITATGNLVQPTPADFSTDSIGNGQMSVRLNPNNQLTFYVRGFDGVMRTGAISLA